MSEHKRDLSGFGRVPKPPRPTDIAPADSQPTTRSAGRTDEKPASGRKRSAGTSVGASPAKKRITLSLPVETAARLKVLSEESGFYYLDLILDAFMRLREEIQSEVNATIGETDLGIRPLRRRAAPGRVQIALLISESDLASVDAAAAAARLDRSGYVAELLDRAGRR